MKKILTALITAVILLMTCGCQKTESSSAKPQIYTSFYAIYDFTKEITGDCADVYNMVPPGTEPHDWEPTVQDMAKLNDADVIFFNGLGMEGWISKVHDALDSDAEFKELSLNVPVDEGKGDPHIWLDPKNVKIMCKNILDTLCNIDPSNKSVYEANYSNYITELDSLDKLYTDTITPLPNKKIVVSHRAYSYLCSAYGLTQTAIDGISADSEPSPDKMMDLVRYINANNIKYIFCEELVSKKTSETLASETGAKLLSLNPFEGLTEEEIANGENYISIMKKNAENLKTALEN